MRRVILLFVLTCAGAVPADGQRADQKALEAAIRELTPRDDIPLYVSPVMVAPSVRGNVRIDGENQERLEVRFGARIEELEDVVLCDDVTRPASCRIKDHGVIFQFFMPEPVENGVLHLTLMVLKDGTGEGGRIGREWWNMALVQRPQVGWTVVEKELTDTADGPW